MPFLIHPQCRIGAGVVIENQEAVSRVSGPAAWIDSKGLHRSSKGVVEYGRWDRKNHRAKQMECVQRELVESEA